MEARKVFKRFAGFSAFGARAMDILIQALLGFSLLSGWAWYVSTWTRNGGIVFFTISRFGGSFYIKRS